MSELVQDKTKIKQVEGLRQSAELQSLLNALPDTYFRMDLDGTILDYHSQNVGELYMKPESFLGKRMQDILPKPVVKLFQSKLNEMLHTGKPVTFKYKLTINNEVNHFDARLNQISLNKQLICVIRDVSEEFKSKASLADSEQFFRTIFEQAAVGVALLRIDINKVVRINQRFCDMLGYSKQEMLDGDLLPKITFPDDMQVSEDLRKKVLNGRKRQYSIEKRYLHKDGHIVWVEVTISPTWKVGELPQTLILVVQDISARKKDEEQLKESEARLKEAQVYAKIGYWESSVDRKTAIWSQQMYELFGLEAQSKAGPETLCNVMDKRDFSTFSESINASFANGHEHHVEYRITKPNDGEQRWIECKGKVVYGDDGLPQKISGFIQDITERKVVEEKLQLSSQVFSDTREGLIITDPQKRIFDVNPAFTRITGYSRDEIIGKNPTILSSGKQSPQFYEEMWQTITNHGYWQGELWNKTKQGELYAESLTISSLKNEQGEVTHYVSMFSDITNSKQQQDQLNFMAHYDVLTKLPNRALFIDRFKQAIAHNTRAGHQFAVCFLDLDNFKPVNDNYGHEIGDRLLIEVANRIKSCIREEDTVSRQGGDEFAILLNDIESASQYEGTLARIHQSLTLPYFIDDIQHTISASSGVTLYPSDNGDIDTLLRHADHAMYQSKLAGKGRFQLYSPASDQRIIRTNLQREEIEKAFINNEFELFYQPKVNMATGDVFGVEALLRWNHPQKGLIQPSGFLSYINGSFLEEQIGKWVLNKALQQLDDWQKQGVKLEMSVNISSKHLLSNSFISDLENILALYSADNAQYLQLEILESSAFGDMTTINNIVKTCQNKLGIRFALDDFGTGYSSLIHLKNLPVDTIKIDQSFVRDMLDDPNDYSIIEGVIALSKSFNRKVIAEGVETSNHGFMLLLMGCDLAQGFAIAEPMTAIAFAQWLKNYRPNKKWLICGMNHSNNTQNSLDIFRIINDEWLEKFKNKILAPPSSTMIWPVFDDKSCHCAHWIHRAKHDQLCANENLQSLEKAHKKIHFIANSIQRMYQQGDVKTARASLEKLETAFDEVREILNRC